MKTLPPFRKRPPLPPGWAVVDGSAPPVIGQTEKIEPRPRPDPRIWALRLSPWRTT